MENLNGWKYVPKFGSVYKVQGNELLFAPVFKDGTPDLESQSVVEFENIEEADAQELRLMFGQNLV